MMRVMTSVRYACGSTALSLQLSTNRSMTALLGAAIAARKQCILAVPGDRPDGALDDVGVDLDAAVFEDAAEARLSREGVADRLGQLAFLVDEGELRLQPMFERIDDRAASRLAGVATLLGGSATDLALDAIKLSGARERFRGDQRGATLRERSQNARLTALRSARTL